MHSRALFLCYIFFPQNDNTVLGVRKVKKYNPLWFVHTHTTLAQTHTDCKHNMPLLESEFEFLDAKAISVLSAHGLQHWPVVLTGGTRLAGPLHGHCCGSMAAGSTWKSLVWLRSAKQVILWLCFSWGLTVLPAVWMLTPWKYPQSWSLGLTDVNPTSSHSCIQGIFTRLQEGGGFIMIRDALLQFMPFSCLQPRTEGMGMNES